MPAPHAIRVLLVVDGYFSLGPQDRDDRSFSVSQLISILKDTAFSGPSRIYLDTAHRDGDQNATIWGKFHFVNSIPDLNHYDQIWLFGYNGPNTNDKNNVDFTKPIDDDEIAAIAKFMQNGGGVLADGDHDGLGCYMCGAIPRVRTMRRWFAEDDNSEYAKKTFGEHKIVRNWPARGPNRADTLQKDIRGAYNFTNQSDDIPQPLELLKVGDKYHPVLEMGQDKYLEEFPDHFHEGEVLGMGGVESSQPWSQELTFVVDGKTVDEYPVREDGERELPQIIAQGQVIGGHATDVEHDKLCDSGFRPDKSVTEPKKINTLSVFDGQKVGVGRVLTDSSFHHFVDLNLIGDPCASDEKTRGFQRAFLVKMSTFYINCVMWLANKRVWENYDYPTYGMRGKYADIVKLL